ncbi:MAG: NAD(P)-binding domain-containing protein [Methanomicrobium sp.]|nr:NAD(P)-binding domain-containing protein [Methanomicrobium sp.]MDD4299549.1 NAD(P)-binding domain-containing protein [Methanomicrobium sp.]
MNMEITGITGIIGTGNMGSMLVRKFIEAGAVSAEDVLVYNHSPEKLEALVKLAGVRAAKSNTDLAAESDIIFICVRPDDASSLFSEIKESLTEDKILVSIISDISIAKIKEWSGHDAVRVIPSVTSECRCGISLITFGEAANESLREKIIKLFGSISMPYVTDEKSLPHLSDITGSSPAIIAAIISEYADAAARRGHVTKTDAELLLTETFLGTAKLLSENKLTPKDLISKVSTKGGITQEGVCVIKKESPAMFDNLLLRMSEKHVLIGEDNYPK